jgi:glycosyltransferase involved in cell wall biosynthesis
VTYLSGYEGFGNAFIEAIYFKKPIIVNRYSIFVEDI